MKSKIELPNRRKSIPFVSDLVSIPMKDTCYVQRLPKLLPTIHVLDFTVPYIRNGSP